MRGRIFFAGLLLLVFSGGLGLSQIQEPQKPEQHFYDVDKEIKVQGTVQKIAMEPRYKNTSPFLIVFLDDKNSEKVYKVELSPKRFFDHDLHQGESLTVTGSFYQTEAATLNIIAREVRFRGETMMLRDKHGFPNWRGRKKKKINGILHQRY